MSSQKNPSSQTQNGVSFQPTQVLLVSGKKANQASRKAKTLYPRQVPKIPHNEPTITPEHHKP